MNKEESIQILEAMQRWSAHRNQLNKDPPMAKNTALSRAKDAKKDEFYTQYDDIQNELNHYTEHFSGKTILCNCDDPFESNFCKFLLRNFNFLGLKRLICTSYSTSPVVGQQLAFDWAQEPLVPGCGYVMDIQTVPMANGRGVSDSDIDKLLKSKKHGVRKLQGDGDFRSEECISYLKQADIVVTNPPFSLFREYVAQLIEFEKKFIIIGNVNAITYKEIFPLIKENQLWMGASIHSGDRKFNVPDDYPLNAAGCGIDTEGRKFIRVKGVRWFTNLDYKERHEELVLFRHYFGHESDYPKYDNYDAINVDKTADIPCDYFEIQPLQIASSSQSALNLSETGIFGPKSEDGELTDFIGADRMDSIDYNGTTPNNAELCTAGLRCNGIMGVPITFLDKYNPNQFEIVGNEYSLNIDQGRGYVGGKRMYSRIFIKRKCSGIMGVPITFLDKYNPDQFEIVGIAKRGAGDPALKSRVYTKADYSNYSDLNAGPVLVQADGTLKNTYPRILIRRRKNNEQSRIDSDS